jgi:putative transposase
MLREQILRHKVSLLAYCITSNHTHLLVNAHGKEQISRLMQCLEGDFAQAYNIRKKRSGAFWQDRYHATLVDGNEHLWRCLRYIDLNMVRAGVVRHPEEWEWCGYRELLGIRKRYCLLDEDRLSEALGDGVDLERLRRMHGENVMAALVAGEMQREGMWTENVAVGSREFVETVKETLKNHRRREIAEADENGSWVLREHTDYPYTS